jgi:hypothetical protein
MNFKINENNKAIYDKNFVIVENDDCDVQQSDGNGGWIKAQPLNNDPQIQEFGGITDLLKIGFLNKNYKVYQKESELKCFVTNEPLEIYDVVAVIDGWEQFVLFAVFMGTIENDTNYLFKYLFDDAIRNYTPKIK